MQADAVETLVETADTLVDDYDVVDCVPGLTHRGARQPARVSAAATLAFL